MANTQLASYAQLPVVLTGAQVAFWVIGTGASPPPSLEMPMLRCEITKTSEKTESTGSTSVAGPPGDQEIWKDWGKGASTWSINVEGVWRVGSPVNIPAFRHGRVYQIVAFLRRPLWLGVTDPGSGYQGNIFVDSNMTTLDPRQGVINWRLAATGQGVLTDPAEPVTTITFP